MDPYHHSFAIGIHIAVISLISLSAVTVFEVAPEVEMEGLVR